MLFFWIKLYPYSLVLTEEKLQEMNRTIALVMIVLGIVMLVWTGFTYTQKEKLVDAGPIQISADKEKV